MRRSLKALLGVGLCAAFASFGTGCFVGRGGPMYGGTGYYGCGGFGQQFYQGGCNGGFGQRFVQPGFGGGFGQQRFFQGGGGFVQPGFGGGFGQMPTVMQGTNQPMTVVGGDGATTYNGGVIYVRPPVNQGAVYMPMPGY